MRNPTELKNHIDRVIDISPCHAFTARSKYYTNAYLDTIDTIQNRICVTCRTNMFYKIYVVSIRTHPYEGIETYYIYPHCSDVHVRHYGAHNYRLWHFDPEKGFTPFLGNWEKRPNQPQGEANALFNEIINALING